MELSQRYVEMRKWGKDGNQTQHVVTATTRQLESMIRLAEAHAKMRFFHNMMSVLHIDSLLLSQWMMYMKRID